VIVANRLKDAWKLAGKDFRGREVYLLEPSQYRLRVPKEMLSTIGSRSDMRSLNLPNLLRIYERPSTGSVSKARTRYRPRDGCSHLRLLASKLRGVAVRSEGVFL